MSNSYTYRNKSWIKDTGLAKEGQSLIDTALEDMPSLQGILKKYGGKKPLKNTRIPVCVIPTPETGAFVWTLKSLGAEVQLCSDNVISVDDRVAAAIDSWGVKVFGKRNQSVEDFLQCIRWSTLFMVDNNIAYPTQIVDDGSDLTKLIHAEKVEWLNDIKGTSEQTTCGVFFDQGLQKRGQLVTPIIDINAGLKASFDNRYGPRESFIPAFAMCKGMQLGGKTALVAGYGMVGKGVVEALMMAGCRVLVAEVNPLRALEAKMQSLEIVTINEAISIADVFVTATSTPHVFTKDQILKMKSGASLCNMGENREYDSHLLENELGFTKNWVNDNLARYKNGEWYVDSLCDGWLLNMRSGGNPARALGITFALHILIQIKLANGWNLEKGSINTVPEEIENEVILLNFPELKDKMTLLTHEQKQYMGAEK